MKNKVKNLIVKHKELLYYVIFGGLTTIVNYISYFSHNRLFDKDELTSTFIAWIVAVLFAYVTNKIFVFKSNATSIKNLLKEIGMFF